MFGVVGAAWGCLLAALLNVPVYYGAMITTLHLRVGQVLEVLWRPFVASAGMAACVVAVLREMTDRWPEAPAMAQLGVGVITGVVAYGALVVLFWAANGRPGASAEGIVMRRLAGLSRLAGSDRPA
jgi:hypothetical protein